MRIANLLLLLGLFTPLKVVSQIPLKLSLSDAISLSKKNSSVIQAARSRLKGAGARLKGAGALSSPQLTIAKGVGINTGGLDEDILITQTLELGDKVKFRVRAASGEEKAARQEVALAELETQAVVSQAYFEALLTESEFKLATDNLENAKAFAKAAELQFQAGDVAKSNLLRSQIELTRAEQSVIAAQTEHDNRMTTICSILGIQRSTPLTLSDPLGFQLNQRPLSEWKSVALKRRPDLIVSRLQKDSRDAVYRGSRLSSLPDLFLEGRHSSLDPSNGGTSLRVGITFPLFDLGRAKSETRSAQASANEQVSLIRELERQIDLDVETSFRNLAQARKSVESFQGGRLDRSRQLLEMAQIGYQKGASTFLELLDAQQVYRAEQTDYLRALAAFNIATITLARAAGGPLP